MRTMSEVVERLRVEHAEALLELQEFDHAMSVILRHFLALQRAIQELSRDLAALGQAEGGSERAALQALIERARRVSATAEQIGGAFEQFQSGLSRWGARETERS